MKYRIKIVFLTHSNDVIYVCSDETIFLKKEDAERQCSLKKDVTFDPVTRKEFFDTDDSSNNQSDEEEKIKAAELQAKIDAETQFAIDAKKKAEEEDQAATDADKKIKDEALLQNQTKESVTALLLTTENLSTLDYPVIVSSCKTLELVTENNKKESLLKALVTYKETIKTV